MILSRNQTQRLTPSFYNGSNCNVQNVTLAQVVDLGREICDEVPVSQALWYPNTSVTKCYYNFIFKVIVFHFLPAVLIDGLLKLAGKKPM